MKKFGLGAATVSTSKRTVKTTTPELYTTPTAGKLRINEAASMLLGVKHGDHLMIISDDDLYLAKGMEDGLTGKALMDYVAENASYGLVKATPIMKDGQPVVGNKVLNKAEKEAVENGTYEGDVDEETGVPTEIKFHGSKLASATKNLNVGAILEFSDSKRYLDLKGDDNTSAVWTIDAESIELELNIDGENVEAVVFGLDFDKITDKAGKTIESADAESNDAESNDAVESAE